jgi:hypothetical protein
MKTSTNKTPSDFAAAEKTASKAVKIAIADVSSPMVVTKTVTQVTETAVAAAVGKNASHRTEVAAPFKNTSTAMSSPTVVTETVTTRTETATVTTNHNEPFVVRDPMEVRNEIKDRLVKK